MWVKENLRQNYHCNKFGNWDVSRNVCSNKNGENLLKLSNPGTFTQFDKNEWTFTLFNEISWNLLFLLLHTFLDKNGQLRGKKGTCYPNSNILRFRIYRGLHLCYIQENNLWSPVLGHSIYQSRFCKTVEGACI